MPDSLLTAPIATVDSLATDTVQAHTTLPPWSVSHIDQAPLLGQAKELLCGTRDSYISGLEPSALAHRVAGDSAILTLLTVMFLLVVFNFKHCLQLFNVFGQELLSVRRRANAFDDHTANETRVLIVLLFQLWVCQGLMAFSVLSSSGTLEREGSLFVPVIAFTALAAVFYLAQLAVYSVVGYTFTDPIGASQWVKGYNATQAFLSLAMLCPAMLMIFYPPLIQAMAITALALYILSRVIFIIKGFRIFYHNFQSLLYFILYLCALEIVPLILIAAAALSVARFLQ